MPVIGPNPKPANGTSGRRRWIPIPGWRLLLAAISIGLLLASLDLLPPGAAWWGLHPMTGQAVGGAFLFIQGGLLLAGFLQAREQERLERVSAVAYASLSQSANDAGRRLLAPLNGADLFQLGIIAEDPGSSGSGSSTETDRDRLRLHGFEPTFAELGGTWHDQRALVDSRLPHLLGDEVFVRRVFRVASRCRRDMQAAAAQWAPTMIIDAERTEDLDQFRDLIYAVEKLIEKLRASHIVGREVEGWTPTPEFVADAAAAYWTAIGTYQDVRDHLVAKAKLGSDAWSDRMAVARSRGATEGAAKA
jgi:hypothetical protein